EDVGSLGGRLTYGFAIDDNGRVYGGSSLADSPNDSSVRRLGHAFLFDNATVGIVDLNTQVSAPDWTLISAVDVRGRYVAGTGDLGGRLHAYRANMWTHTVDDASGGWLGD